MISIIIPTYNEAVRIAETLSKIMATKSGTDMEIIVVDGGSTDETVAVAQSSGVRVLLSEHKGRAAQMNKGASEAKGEILYFLHADSIPPYDFAKYILEAHQQNAVGGCFRLAFDYQHWFLQANCWFTRLDLNAVRFGDQSLFISTAVFRMCAGFREDLLLMEDQEIIYRIKKFGKFKVMGAAVTTSARKYLDNGIYKTQSIFFLIWFLYYLGFSQKYLVSLYKRLFRHHKI